MDLGDSAEGELPGLSNLRHFTLRRHRDETSAWGGFLSYGHLSITTRLSESHRESESAWPQDRSLVDTIWQSTSRPHGETAPDSFRRCRPRPFREPQEDDPWGSGKQVRSFDGNDRRDFAEGLEEGPDARPIGTSHILSIVARRRRPFWGNPRRVRSAGQGTQTRLRTDATGPEETRIATGNLDYTVFPER